MAHRGWRGILSNFTVWFQSSKPNSWEGPAPVSLTPSAVAMVRKLMAEHKSNPPRRLRIRIMRGGIMGYLHKLDLDMDADTNDVVWDSDGIPMIAALRQIAMLRGSRVDHGLKDGEVGFIVDNPKFNGEEAERWFRLLTKDESDNM